MTARHFSYAVLLTGLTISAHAASFPCDKAQRPVEKIICGAPQLNTADESIGAEYRQALAKLSANGVGIVRADQVQWLTWAQLLCGANEPSARAATVAKCMLPLYKERTKQLRTAALHRDGMMFFTRTQYLAEPEEKLPANQGAEHLGFGTVQASWTVADSADPNWIAWNQAIERRAFALAVGDATDHATQNAPAQTPVWTNRLAEAQDTTILSQIKNMDHGRVTATLSTESMGHGAAHPSELFETLTWLLDSARPLRATDVFAPDSTWRQQVAAACWTSITSGEQKAYIYPGVTGPDAKPLQDVIVNTANWTLEPDGLHISYPEYSVSPRIAPVDDTVLPWSRLKPVLAAGFVTP